MKYSAPLDGLRAVSIVAVIVNHAQPAWLPGGFTGVDVFFVLSGYLITTIIAEALERQAFSFREFYLRRVQRLIPNLLCMLIAVMAAAALLLPKATARTHGLHAFWTVLNASNFFIWENLGDYWGIGAGSSPLTHTWSLAIEEQFYLFYPITIVVLWRWRKSAVMPMLAMASIVSLGICLALMMTKRPQAAFYLLPSRGWELLTGGLLAIAIRNSVHLHYRHAAAAGWIGAAMLVGSFVFLDEQFSFPGFVTLLPVIGSALLILSVHASSTRLSALLSAAPAVAVGKASYSLYLWHWPCIVFAKIIADRKEWPIEKAGWAGVAVGVLVGFLSYRYVETPLRRPGPARRQRLGWIAAGSLGALATSAWLKMRPLIADSHGRFDPVIDSARPYDTRRSSDDYRTLGYQGYSYDVHFDWIEDWGRARWRHGGIQRSNGTAGPPRVVVLGSSHGMMYGRLIDEICRERGLPVAFWTVSGADTAFFSSLGDASFRGPFDSCEDARDFDEIRRDALRKWQPDLVILADRWDKCSQRPEWAEEQMREFLGMVGPHVKMVAFVAQVPVHSGGDHINLREVVSARTASASDPLPTLFPDSRDGLRREMAERMQLLCAEFSHLRVLRPDRLFYQSDGSILYAKGRTFFYMDDDHLCDAGSERVRGMLTQVINEACR
jgi:peptidoglycan/LPS O-acetylase OafA/YrhL